LLQGNIAADTMTDILILCIMSVGIVLVGAAVFTRRLRVR
jgi:hypothetical protein